MEKEKNKIKCCLTLSSEKKDSNMVNVNLEFTPALEAHGTAPETRFVGVLLFRTVALYTSSKDFRHKLIELLERYHDPTPFTIPRVS